MAVFALAGTWMVWGMQGDGMSPLQNSITRDARKMQLVDNQIYGSETNRILQRSRNFLK